MSIADAIQVTYSLSKPDTAKRELEGLISALKEFEQNALITFFTAYLNEVHIDKKSIKKVYYQLKFFGGAKMFLNFIDIAYAMGPTPQGGGQGGAGGLFASLIPLILIFVIFYFLLIRPQQKRAKEHKGMIENLKKGDKIITSGGIYGVIEAVGTNTITLKIAENTRIKIGKAYVATLRAASDED